jgi:protein-S-isoprenylcysteine O-methyltransferase Ste14
MSSVARLKKYLGVSFRIFLVVRLVTIVVCCLVLPQHMCGWLPGFATGSSTGDVVQSVYMHLFFPLFWCVYHQSWQQQAVYNGTVAREGTHLATLCAAAP